jgi:hypothetical protein
MNHHEAWRQSVRAALTQPDEVPDEAAGAVASNAITWGTRRLVASMSLRAAALGVAVASGVVLLAYGWAEAEISRTADVTLSRGAPWTP